MPTKSSPAYMKKLTVDWFVNADLILHTKRDKIHTKFMTAEKKHRFLWIIDGQVALAISAARVEISWD